DVIRDERREPAHAIADLVARSEMRRSGDHERDRAGIAARFSCAVCQEPDAPTDEARIRKLDDRAIGDPTGELERLRPVSDDPDREALLAGPVEPEPRSFVGDLAP